MDTLLDYEDTGTDALMIRAQLHYLLSGDSADTADLLDDLANIMPPDEYEGLLSWMQ